MTPHASALRSWRGVATPADQPTKRHIGYTRRRRYGQRPVGHDRSLRLSTADCRDFVTVTYWRQLAGWTHGPLVEPQRANRVLVQSISTLTDTLPSGRIAASIPAPVTFHRRGHCRQGVPLPDFPTAPVDFITVTYRRLPSGVANVAWTTSHCPEHKIEGASRADVSLLRAD